MEIKFYYCDRAQQKIIKFENSAKSWLNMPKEKIAEKFIVEVRFVSGEPENAEKTTDLQMTLTNLWRTGECRENY